MGSSNLQCAISKETIINGDETVTFILEPVLSESGDIQNITKPATSQGQYFKINSLPIFGVYDDYGRSIASEGQDIVLSLVKSFYDFDYSEDSNDEWGASGKRLHRGGYVTSPYDTNTYELVMLKSSYDILIKSTDDKFISKLLKADKIEQAFGESIDDELLSAIKKMTPHFAIMQAATFLKGLRNIGFSLTPAPTIAAQRGIEDFKMSISTHKALADIDVCNTIIAGKPAEFCLLTKKAISDNQIVHILPIISKRKSDKPIDLISFDNHSVNARYKAITGPIECILNNGEFTLTKPLKESVKNALTCALQLSSKTDDGDVLNTIVKQRKVTTGSFFKQTYQISYVAFGEQAMNYFATKQFNLHNSLRADFEVFLEKVKVLHDLGSQEYSSFDSFEDALKNANVFNEAGLGVVFRTIDIYSSEVEPTQKIIKYLLTQFFKRIPPVQEPLAKYPRQHNLFYDTALHTCSHQSQLHDIVIESEEEKLIAAFENINCTEAFSYAAFAQLSELLDINITVISILSKLNKAAIPLMPFDTYTGDLNILEQHEIIDSISRASYKRLDTLLKEYESEDY
jgi:hypothetical protein